MSRTISPSVEYLARIHRVQDHIERHLTGELRLEDLARVACFSPFHFSRIYAAVTGETLREFILRLRVERAAAQLRTRPEQSVTGIALDCGFGGSAAFARAFRAAFGVTASDWRKQGKALRKPGEADRSPGQVSPGAAAYVAGVGEAPDGPEVAGDGGVSMKAVKTKAADEVKVVERPATTIAYVRHVGPYAGDAALFQRLFGRVYQWAGPRGLVGPDAPVAIYHDNPGVTAPEKLRLSVGIPVPAGTAPERDVGMMELPAGRYVAARYELESRRVQRRVGVAVWHLAAVQRVPARRRSRVRALPQRPRAGPAGQARGGAVLPGEAALTRGPPAASAPAGAAALASSASSPWSC
ncbi:MAG: AraC family transcriptional regulator [Anaeromyxobacter sp.]